MRSLQICLSLILFYHCLYIKGSDLQEESNFMALVGTSGFVDKTMLIKEIFKTGKRLLITAPRKFGKSTNLNMLNRFLSMKSLADSNIINTFKSLYIYENDTSFFSEHFGQYPVVNVNFKVGIVSNYAQAVYQYKRIIHYAYLEHKYLQISKRLSSHNKRMCKYWSGDESYVNMAKADVMSGLVQLLRMVKQHNQNKKTVLLIDEYDSFFNNALLNVMKNVEYDRVLKLNLEVLSTLINGSNNYTQLTVITGNSYISSGGLSEVDNLKRYYFQGDHPFGKYYGLTEDEVASLYNNHDFKKFSKNQVAVKYFYNGYTSKQGRHFYNTYSFLNFLDTGRKVVYWNTNKYFLDLIGMIKFRKVAWIFDSMLKYKTLTAKLQNNIKTWQIKHLRMLYSRTSGYSLFPSRDILLTHFLELGLLTYDKTLNNTYLGDDEVKLKIPNQEVHDIILKQLKVYFFKTCNLSVLRPVSYYAFRHNLYRLYNSTSDFCKQKIEVFIKGIKKT